MSRSVGTTLSVDPAWLRAAYLDDKRTIASIAAETGASKKDVAANLRDIGVSIRHGRSPVSDAHRAEQYRERQGARSAHVWGAHVRTVEDADYNRSHIYLLLDPMHREARYVGQTVQPAARLQQHLLCRDNNHRKNEWITRLAADGLQPRMVVVATCLLGEADVLETEWINRLRCEGADLYNEYAPAPAYSRVTFIPAVELSLAGIDLLPLRQEAGLPSNVLAKIEFDPTTGCWLWTAAKTNGYGVVQYAGTVHRAHRVAYTCLVGQIPAKYVLDHRKDVCGNRSCVYPGHLEPVPNRTNILRGGAPAALHAAKTHCIHGHEFTPENTRFIPTANKGRGARHCITCSRESDRRRYAKKKALAGAGAA